ncbi:hypothetical protein GCM10009547_15070 [Sporichthya brevicatena]|uniref:Secreted protein n=1 Tax=Sporichthya brevicatena TaxID=171442 RepID=A0ABP3RUG2_9ACTN
MRTRLALLATAVALPLSAAPIASAAPTARPAQDVITNCSKTKYGQKVRIKARDNGRYTVVRVTHRDGTGNFTAPRVKRVFGGASGGGQPSENLGGGEWRDRRRTLPPSFRTSTRFVDEGYTVDISATFVLRSGRRIHLTCSLR